jgi:hypothetical protein
MSGNAQKIEGVARAVSCKYGSVKKRFGGTKRTVTMNFRVEVIDNEGNIKDVVPVEMYGEGKKDIFGDITDGDTVQVKGKREDGVIRVKEVKNKTTNTKVKVKKRHMIEGVARAVARHAEPSKSYLMAGGTKSGVTMFFRIEVTDKEGNIVEVVPVEMRGTEIRGRIVDGDTVQVKDKRKDGVIRTKEVINKTTNSKIKVRK